MPSGRISKGMNMRPHAMTSANIMGQGTGPSSSLHTERNVRDVAKTTILRQSADLHSDNRQSGGPRKQWTRCASRMRLAW